MEATHMLIACGNVLSLVPHEEVQCSEHRLEIGAPNCHPPAAHLVTRQLMKEKGE